MNRPELDRLHAARRHRSVWAVSFDLPLSRVVVLITIARPPVLAGNDAKFGDDGPIALDREAKTGRPVVIEALLQPGFTEVPLRPTGPVIAWNMAAGKAEHGNVVVGSHSDSIGVSPLFAHHREFWQDLATGATGEPAGILRCDFRRSRCGTPMSEPEVRVPSEPPTMTPGAWRFLARILLRANELPALPEEPVDGK